MATLQVREREMGAISEASEVTTMELGDGSVTRGARGAKPPRKSRVEVTGNFIRNEGSASKPVTPKAARYEWVRTIMKSYKLANFMAAVVLLDAYCTCAGIDARAANQSPAIIWRVVSDVCLVLYTFELFLILFLFDRLSVIKDWMMILDFFIVCCGWLEIILLLANVTDLGFRIKVLRVLRLVRIFRLIRLLRRVRNMKELHKLATMMATCMRTLLWCFLLCFIVMTGWAMLIVEVVNPIKEELVARDASFFVRCQDCEGATGSVMSANLLLFKTVIAGDSWGELAVPIITEHPATAIIFVGSQLTIVFGVVNLIVAVVVDTFAEARENDVQNLAEEMEEEIQQDSKMLTKVFQRINKDGSGQLSLDDLIEGARTDPAFQSRLRVMDIDENDLQQLFHMIDTDGSGTIEVAEFIGPLSRWAHDSKTAPRFIKYNMLQTMHLQEDLIELSAECFNELAARIDDLSRQLYLERGTAAMAPAAPAAPVPGESSASVGQVSMKTTEQKVREMQRAGSPTTGSASETESEATQEEVPQDSFEAQGSPGANVGSPLGGRVMDIDQPNKSPEVPLFLAPKTEEKYMHEQQKTLEHFLEATMLKLEAKLDALLKDSKKIKALGKYPRRQQGQKTRLLMSPRVSDGAFPARTLRQANTRPQLHPEAFRSMYMTRRSSGVQSGNNSEAVASYRPDTFPATLEEAAGGAGAASASRNGASFSKDRVWRSVSRGRVRRAGSQESERVERSYGGYGGVASSTDWL